MSAQTILLLFVVLSLFKLGGDLVLTVLNLGHVRVNADRVPAAFAGTVDEDTYARSISYTRARGRFGLLAEGASAAVLLAVVLTGFLGSVDGLVRSLPIHSSLQGVLFIAVVSFFFWLVELPFSLYSIFSIEARFGFNRTTPRLFLVDMAKGLAISAVIGIPVLLGLF